MVQFLSTVLQCALEMYFTAWSWVIIDSGVLISDAIGSPSPWAMAAFCLHFWINWNKSVATCAYSGWDSAHKRGWRGRAMVVLVPAGYLPGKTHRMVTDTSGQGTQQTPPHLQLHSQGKGGQTHSFQLLSTGICLGWWCLQASHCKSGVKLHRYSGAAARGEQSVGRSIWGLCLWELKPKALNLSRE